MSEVFVGTMQPFGFSYAPAGWAFCNGQQMSIAQYQVLYTLIGTTYGGDGVQTFWLPNTQGRTLVGQGTSNLGTAYTIGQMGGHETVTLSQQNLPIHTHSLSVSGAAATLPAAASGANDFLAAANGSDPTSGDAVTVNIYSPTGGATVPVGGLFPSGNNMPVDVMQPYLTNNYCISLYGIFPSRN